MRYAFSKKQTRNGAHCCHICFVENIFSILGFTWVSRLSKLFQDLKDVIEIPPCRFPVFLKTAVDEDCVGPALSKMFKVVGFTTF